jgi:hypothetical protein
MQSFFKAKHFAAMQDISGSPTVSLAHKATAIPRRRFTESTSSAAQLSSTAFIPPSMKLFLNLHMKSRRQN